MPNELVAPAHVAMLAHGDEVYGIGTIEQIYAEGWPEMTTVCLGKGHHYEWLRSRGAKVELVEGLAQYPRDKHLRALAALPLRQREAKRDAERIYQLLEGRGIRVIHTQWFPQQLIAGHMRRLGYKSVWQINNNTNREKLFGIIQKLNHRLARWGADLLLPASDFIADNWAGCGVPMTTIRNSAASIFASVSPTPESPPIRCLVAGRLTASKGHHVAVEAVLKARRAGYDVRLDIYGGPIEGNAYADALRETVASADAAEAIRFMGFCKDIRQRHRDYHLGFQCRMDPEPCSLWVCETMVDGLPLIASATGGTPELVDDGVTGFLVPADDADALAAKLLQLCEDPQQLDAMRRAAFERGQQQFLTTRMLSETLGAYQTLH